MQYRIIGSTMPAVETILNRGESMYTQSGGMAWMSQGVEMTTSTKGGVLKGLGRKMFAGESMFMATYTAVMDNATVAFASTVAGEIVPIDLAQHQGLICQKGAFLCATPGVQMNMTFTKKFSAGLFGGEGFILQQAAGNGLLFLEIDGDRVEKTLAPGEVLYVDTGNLVAFDPTVQYEIQMIKGVKNIFFGGEGLFNTKLTGPGKVILQTQNFNEFASRILAMMPRS
ncbi:TIGR00266 family protein [Ruminococcus sp. 210702-SL.1.03]|uniref:TIGR00266 family protein n=1 Tax=Ruminococcus sp. 210702-SL.1.03 TaxID=2883233 RepID=UPI001D09561E|nr:TIGR00266 family protein [Ruminococcus sp. 210702-SL.1.03]MCB6616104.1 TIGR00266 family protein [Ruminococcus sp. 210702-SL.1.03]